MADIDITELRITLLRGVEVVGVMRGQIGPSAAARVLLPWGQLGGDLQATLTKLARGTFEPLADDELDRQLKSPEAARALIAQGIDAQEAARAAVLASAAADNRRRILEEKCALLEKEIGELETKAKAAAASVAAADADAATEPAPPVRVQP